MTPRPGEPQTYEVVGPLCETSDTLGHERPLGPVEVGDLVAVLDAGAYGFVMASNYNRRRMPAEVLVDDGALARHPPAAERTTTCWSREVVSA